MFDGHHRSTGEHEPVVVLLRRELWVVRQAQVVLLVPGLGWVFQRPERVLFRRHDREVLCLAR